MKFCIVTGKSDFEEVEGVEQQRGDHAPGYSRQQMLVLNVDRFRIFFYFHSQIERVGRFPTETIDRNLRPTTTLLPV
jgi:hypothetical protein